jgi:hypothetical protein
VRSLITCALALVPACEQPPVAWREVTALSAADAAGARLALDADGVPLFVREVAPAFQPPDGACGGSVVFARAASREWFAAWWQPRPDGSAAVVVARSRDGGESWSSPVVADGRDRSTDHCDRPAPAIAAQGAYVHLAYALRAESVPGVWFTHSMEHGEVWHTPIPVVFGDAPVRASVAAHGDTVGVAYEDPNSTPRRVALALSCTAGHRFEARVPVSSGSTAASEPRVAIRGRTVAAAWTERPAGAVSAVAGRQVVRVGALQPSEWCR